jgi:hypothetical protein
LTLAWAGEFASCYGVNLAVAWFGCGPRVWKQSAWAVETAPFQNGARQHFGVNSEQDLVDAGVGGGVCFLLWGEPGLRLVWVWASLFGVGCGLRGLGGVGRVGRVVFSASCEVVPGYKVAPYRF